MGNWQLEVARMAMYIAFPVVLFHWFNQPENFEEWVIKTRRESFPPENKKDREMLEKFIAEYNRESDLMELRKMEEAQNKFEAMEAANKLR